VDANIFMLTIQIEKEQLLDAILQMPQRELEQFVAKAFSHKARERTSALSEREAELAQARQFG
jgi:FixJ family two-component response regulator